MLKKWYNEKKTTGGKCMRCPKCGLPSLVLLIVDKPKKEIPSAEDVSAMSVSIVYNLWTSRERTLVVVKKKTVREQFSRDKIFNGIIRSAQKRPVSSDEINMVNRIEQNSVVVVRMRSKVNILGL